MLKKIGLPSGILIVIIGLVFFVSNAIAQQKTYGKPIEVKKAPIVKISAILAQPDKYEGKKLIVEGRITQVCQTSGCWLLLSDGANELYVKFYEFTVSIKPKTKIKVQGTIRVQEQVPYLAGEGVAVQPE